MTKTEFIATHNFERMTVDDFITFCQTECSEDGKPLNNTFQYMRVLTQLKIDGIITEETETRLFSPLYDKFMKK